MFNQKQVCTDLLTLTGLGQKEEQDALLGKIMREIRSRPIVKQGYSSREIKAFVQRTISLASREKASKRAGYIKKTVKRLHSEFQKNLGTWNFIVPIENMKLQPKSLKIGKAKFFTFTQYKRKEMRTRSWRLIKDNPNYNIEWKKKFVKDYDEKILSLISGKTCALVQVRGRLEKAQLIAYDKVETAIAVIKLYRTSLYDEQMQYFHITGKVVPTTNRLTLRYSEDGHNINPMMEKVGFFFPFNLDDKRIQLIRRAGFRKLSEILKKEKLNEIESVVINSIRLFASACDVVVTKSKIHRPIGLGFPPDTDSRPKTTYEEMSLNERLVRLFIALESLLIFDEKEPLRSNISERCAFLLAKPRTSKKETYEVRKAIKDFVAYMYDQRSAYVHHRKCEIDHKTLGRLTRYVQETILSLILVKDRLKLAKATDLKSYFERKKLS